MAADLEFQKQVIDHLAELRTQMKLLVGNGQPGLIQKIDTRVTTLETAQAVSVGERRGRKDLWAVALSLLAAAGELFHIYRH